LNCPGCGHEAAKELAAKGIPEGEPGFSLRRCPGCGLGWTSPVLADSEIGAWYPQQYYGEENQRFHWSLELLVRLFRYRRARVIRRRTQPGKVLDVGCGRGKILDYLRSLGYEVQGVELSDHAARHARERVGIDVHVGQVAEAPFADGTFAAVIFWHTLEHFREPFRALDRARDLLEPGGLIAVAVPNSESLQAKLTGADWFHLDIPRHYHHFGLASLERALSHRGFEVVQVDHFSLEQNPYGWIQSLLNRMGFRFNLLYDWLKDRSSRTVQRRRYLAQAALMLPLAALLVPLSLALTLLETALKRGGTIEVYAVKK